MAAGDTPNLADVYRSPSDVASLRDAPARRSTSCRRSRAETWLAGYTTRRERHSGQEEKPGPQGPPPWWKQILVALATIGMPGLAAREMRNQMENPPEPYRGPVDPASERAARAFLVVFFAFVLLVLFFVVRHWLR